MIYVRLYNRELDYPIVSKWWEAHGWPPVPADALPPLGAIMFTRENGVETDLCASFLYMAVGCGFSIMEWTVSNPIAPPIRVAKALVELVAFLKDQAAQNDYGLMATSTTRPTLVRLYERAGFQKTDTDVTHMVMSTRT